MATTPVYAIPYQTLSDPPDGAALGADLALAVEYELIRIDAAAAADAAALAALGDPATTGWFPTWAASAGSPSIGNGTATARYRRLGKRYDLEIHLIGGSTSNYGTAGAYWTFNLSALPGWTAAAGTYLGTVAGLDALTLEYGGYCKMFPGGDTIELFRIPSGRWTNTAPWTFGTSDTLDIQIRVEST